MVKHKFQPLFLMALGYALLAADHHTSTLVRGYQAYLQRNYDVALNYYECAMQRSSNPGWYARQLGCIAAQAGRYEEASLWFSRSLEDAEGEDLKLSLFGQATAWTQMALRLPAKEAVPLLQQTITSFRKAMELQPARHSEINSSDIEHNLAIAIHLLQQKQLEPDQSEITSSQNQETPPISNDPPEGNTSSSTRDKVDLQKSQNGQIPDTRKSVSPGRGSLSSRQSDIAALTRNEAEQLLEQCLNRLKHPLIPTRNQPGARDW
ncbi:MAG TPA: tetratricopeptide repeat protein [Gemmatales bacterium]|nr:tetratricopeptide repeat protein [Gemmatales bacterium]